MERRVTTSMQSTNLADLLERVLDKGVVIVGDITVFLADVELLSIKVRLVVCSVEKALAMGINWWQNDPYLKQSGLERLRSGETGPRLEAGGDRHE